MARLRVQIRLDLLRAHLAFEDREPKSDADVLAWLADAGFVRADGAWWIVNEPDLGQLRPEEVSVVEDAVTVRPVANAPAVAQSEPDAVEAA